MMKNHKVIKISGSVALLLSLAGVLLAVGGQFNFLGNERTPTVMQKPTQRKGEKPKYSFYDELKKRKTEIDGSGAQAAASRTLQAAQKRPLNQDKVNRKNDANHTDKVQYVVQVGAFTYEADARKVEKQVVSLGYTGRVVRGTTGGRKFLTQVGPLIGRQQADAAQRHLKNQGMPTLIKRLK